jgi:hypothetical protein
MHLAEHSQKIHELIKPFLKHDLEMKITAQNDALIITLTQAKTTKGTTATTDIPDVRRV